MIDLVTWKYDEGTFVRFPTTQSFKPVGTVKVGDKLPDAPHMTAIAVESMPTPDYMKGRI